MNSRRPFQLTSDARINPLQPNENMYRPPRMMETPEAGTRKDGSGVSVSTPDKKDLDKKRLQELFNHQLRDMQQAEQKLTEALPGMVKYYTRQELVKNLDAYLEETKKQIEKLNTLAVSIGINSLKAPSSYQVEAGGNIVPGRPRIVRPRVMARTVRKRSNLNQK